jgi:hypothetical protein
VKWKGRPGCSRPWLGRGQGCWCWYWGGRRCPCSCVFENVKRVISRCVYRKTPLLTCLVSTLRRRRVMFLSAGVEDRDLSSRSRKDSCRNQVRQTIDRRDYEIMLAMRREWCQSTLAGAQPRCSHRELKLCSRLGILHLAGRRISTLSDFMRISLRNPLAKPSGIP